MQKKKKKKVWVAGDLSLNFFYNRLFSLNRI